MRLAQVKANATLAIIPPCRVGDRRAAWLAAGLLALGLSFGWQAAPLVAQTPVERFERLVSSADAAWREGRYPDARAGYEAALAIDSVGSSRAVYRLAVLLSWDGALDRAIPLFQRYTRLEPRDEEGRIALAKALAWNGQTGSAVAVYDSILTRDATYRDAALGAALALAWAGRFRDAVGRYDRWLGANPRDVEAELARARVLAWWGKLHEAEQTYAAIAKRGERLEGYKGVALVAAWRGDLGRSESVWRMVTARAPRDAEGWVGLAQVLRWTGRADEARDALQRALAADPKNQDAAEQLRWVRADLAPAFEPGATVTWDSDDNRSVVANATVSGRPFRRGRLALAATHRASDFGATHGTSSTARAVLRLHVGRAMTITGDGGLTRTASDPGAVHQVRSRPVGGFAATARIGPRLTLGINARTAAFDETVRMMERDVEVRSVGAEGELRLAGRLGLAGRAERASLRGGSAPNERRSGFAALRWRPHRAVTWSVSGVAFGYDRNLTDGYFSPSRYQLGETVLRWAPGRDLGWGAQVEGAVGAQRVTFGSAAPITRGTQRVGLGLAYRPRPGSEVGIDYAFSNVSANGAASGSVYRSQSLGLRVRLTW